MKIADPLCVLREIVRANDDAPGYGMRDQRDNDGGWYQSADLAAWMLEAKKLLAVALREACAGERELAYHHATTCACTAAERYVETCPKHGNDAKRTPPPAHAGEGKCTQCGKHGCCDCVTEAKCAACATPTKGDGHHG